MTRRSIPLHVSAIALAALAIPCLRTTGAPRGAPGAGVQTSVHVERVRVQDGARQVIATFDTLVEPGSRFSCDASVDARTIHLDGIVERPLDGRYRARIHFSDAARGSLTEADSDLILQVNQSARLAGSSNAGAPTEVVEVTLRTRPD